MINMTLEGTNINITCKTAEEAFTMYTRLGHYHNFIVNGQKLPMMGPVEDNNPYVKSYFSGYTRGFFKKFETAK